MKHYPQAPRTTEEASALPQVSLDELWSAGISPMPLDGYAVVLFTDSDGELKHVKAMGERWVKVAA